MKNHRPFRYFKTLPRFVENRPPTDRQSALVLEDIDASSITRNSNDGISKMTFSGLHNAINGIAAQEGHPLFLTTNHPENLDPAMVRPGRVNLALEIGMPGPAQAERLFLLFFPGEFDLAKRFSACIGDKKISPAEIQAHLLAHVRNCKILIDTFHTK